MINLCERHVQAFCGYLAATGIAGAYTSAFIPDLPGQEVYVGVDLTDGRTMEDLWARIREAFPGATRIEPLKLVWDGQRLTCSGVPCLQTEDEMLAARNHRRDLTQPDHGHLERIDKSEKLDCSYHPNGCNF